MQRKLLFLGTGGSLGIPVIGCKCAVCRSSSPFNKRLRPSAVISLDDSHILIDAGQDFRQQALKHHVEKISGVIFTHAHYDHTAGIDDLRVFNKINGGAIPCLLSTATYEDLLIRYDYILAKDRSKDKESLTSTFDVHILKEPRGSYIFADQRIDYFTYHQNKMPVTGVRIADVAYISDIKQYSEDIFDELAGVKILIISALRFTPSPMHLSVDEAIEFSLRVGAGKTYFTHISHDLDHQKTNAYLPPSIEMAYDGLAVQF